MHLKFDKCYAIFAPSTGKAFCAQNFGLYFEKDRMENGLYTKSIKEAIKFIAILVMVDPILSIALLLAKCAEISKMYKFSTYFQ